MVTPIAGMNDNTWTNRDVFIEAGELEQFKHKTPRKIEDAGLLMGSFKQNNNNKISEINFLSFKHETEIT